MQQGRYGDWSLISQTVVTYSKDTTEFKSFSLNIPSVTPLSSGGHVFRVAGIITFFGSPQMNCAFLRWENFVSRHHNDNRLYRGNKEGPNQHSSITRTLGRSVFAYLVL
jgi:hypothetical protein